MDQIINVAALLASLNPPHQRRLNCLLQPSSLSTHASQFTEQSIEKGECARVHDFRSGLSVNAQLSYYRTVVLVDRFRFYY